MENHERSMENLCKKSVLRRKFLFIILPVTRVRIHKFPLSATVIFFILRTVFLIILEMLSQVTF